MRWWRRNPLFIGTIIAGGLLAMIGMPRLLYSDHAAIPPALVLCVKRDAKQLFDNPLERILIQQFVVEKHHNTTGMVKAYTLGGLPYASAEVSCNEGAKVLWRRWFGSKSMANPSF